MLRLDGIGVTLGDFTLRDVSLQVERGEYFVLLGPTGAGKTVLLEIIAGLLPPACGEVTWDGVALTNRPPEQRPTAVVFQDLGLFPHLSVAGNIGYGPRVRGLPREERDARVTRLARLMGIEGLLDRGVAGLSGGEKQRVALARALAVEPSILLLDEPLSALDALTRDRLRDELRRIHRDSGTTTIHVTHDREVALAVADRIAVLLDRTLGVPQSPEPLFRTPGSREVAEFLGHRNVLDASEARAMGILGIPAAAAAVWIRPEEILVGQDDPEGIDVEVTATRLIGSQVEVRLAVGEGELLALVRPRAAEQRRLTPGRRVRARVPGHAVHVFSE